MRRADLPPPDVLDQYDVGRVVSIEAAGGTAGRTWRIRADAGIFLLRLRGVRTSTEARLRFDHKLRAHLVVHGIPTATAVRTRTNAQWVRREGRVFELYPFVEGRPFRPDCVGEITEAARALARFHAATASFAPPSGWQEDIAQYTTLGLSDRTSSRLEDPVLQRENVGCLLPLAPGPSQREQIGWCLARIDSLMARYGEDVYRKLCGWIVHGDYTPANLLFDDEGSVVGIFDFDWAYPGLRCRDVADGLYFFGCEPREIDPADIWSLTDAAAFAPDRCATFLNGYQSISPLSELEIDTIPSAFEGRWFSIRLEGMAKVRPEDRLRFFLRDIEKPLRWLDEHWRQLCV